MKRKAQIVFLSLCALALVLVPLLTLIGPHKSVSYYEQRGLAKFPELSREAVLDGTYFSELETVYKDHIFQRDRILKVNAIAELLLGRVTVNNIIVNSDKLLDSFGFLRWGLDYLKPEAEAIAAQYASLNGMITAYGGQFCYLGLPQQTTYFADEYPAYMDSRLWHTTGIRDIFGAAMETQGVPFLNMYAAFQAAGQPEEYYYDSDHHSSGEGAFFTYLTLMEQLSAQSGGELDYLTEEDFTKTTLKNPFLGSSNRKLYGLWDSADAVTLYTPKTEIAFTRYDNGVPKNSINALPYTEEEVTTYSVYMGGDVAETVIQTNRPDLPSILIYGDSFTNPLESVLWANFNETRTLDYRYYTAKSLRAYIEEYRPDYVVCVRDESTYFARTGNGRTD
ncbi:MAG: hypothetical protein E7429_03865 [Ruminococcaceae bacterium]|nr:hypothetical protein [Oscillospiraceae bacterium]